MKEVADSRSRLQKRLQGPGPGQVWHSTRLKRSQSPQSISMSRPSYSLSQIQQKLNEAEALLHKGRTIQVKRLMEEIGPLPDTLVTPVLLRVAGIFHQVRDFTRAEYYYHKILEQVPHVLAYINLGHICHFTGRIGEAVAYRRQAIAHCPDDISLYHDLGCSLICLGQKEEGLALLRRAVAGSDDPIVHSDLLFRMHHMGQLDQQALFTAHQEWARRFAPVEKTCSSFQNDPDPQRRLRIGYISPDFRTHPVAFFFESLLDGHDRNLYTIYGYGHVTCPDDTTHRLQSKFDYYRSIVGWDDPGVVSMIQDDGIDILVDLAGHTPGHRLGVLAYKPAPLQGTYLGYPDTTGLVQIDFRLTDTLSTPPGSEPFYSESLEYLPQGFLCYRPPHYAPSVGPLPCASNGYITFGVFNNTSKINVDMLALWARLLQANPEARLLIKSRAGKDPHMNKVLVKPFIEQGINTQRIKIEDQKPALEYLRLYHQVDIALDTFPYNGTTTTCDAMWMGVPVISLVGQHHASRVGLSLLTQAGMAFFAVPTTQAYIDRATVLAGKREALNKIRISMRERLLAGGLCNATAFTRTVESAYRRRWRTWCEFVKKWA